ncbi:MAG: N-acetyltransferase [candidate division Zixibacteria bacterium]|nr:N-acetyltransferase [candidate division Zixibacteria bacterium]
MRIKAVENKSDLKRFILFLYRHYKSDPYWVPPLISERNRFFDPLKNPFFQHARVKYFLAEDGSKITGRIAAIVNFTHNQYHNDKVGFFGHFECIDDYEVACELFDAAKQFLKANGMEVMRGPANFSTNDDAGFLLQGYNSRPVIMMPYNPEYYNEFCETYGMTKAMDLNAYYMDKESAPPGRMNAIAERIKSKENVVVRKLDVKNLPREVGIIKQIYNSAWSKNWGFIPMSEAEIDFLVADLKKILDPDIAYLAFVDGKPAGFSLALPDINPVLQKLKGRLFPLGWLKYLWYADVKGLIDGVRVITLGVLPEFQKKGIEVVFMVDTFNEGTKKGYNWGEFSWILEDNYLMSKPLESMGARLYKVYRMYEMRI